MATKKVKPKDEERLDDTHIERVIEFLENKGTKKGACEILNISYNTARLDKLINNYKEKKQREAEKRAEKRGKPATDSEIGYVVSSYLEGLSIEAISKALYRTTSFVNAIIDKYGVPRKHSAYSYFTPPLVPEEAMRDSFSVGELVYSVRYDSLARVEAEIKPGVYRIYLKSEKQQQYAYQPTEELASLQHLKEYIRG